MSILTKNTQIVIVAGEESGDQHAAVLIKQLLNVNPTLKISGIGGQHMQNSGAEIINNLAIHGVTGLTAVIKNIKIIYQAMQQIKLHLLNKQPKLLILVDYPGFNLHLAKFAKKNLAIKIIYYISPQIWAWKMQRIEIIRKYIDHMAVIFPFEKILYQRQNIAASFVGHPLVEKINSLVNINFDFMKELHIGADKKIIALLPGSRKNEIKYHMPVFIKAIQQLNNTTKKLHFIIPIAKTITIDLIKNYIPKNINNITLLQQQTLPAIACSDCVIVASGTAALECALMIKPMCIIYKASIITAAIASQVIKVKYFGLCNLLANKMIVPELLQYDCNSQEIVIIINKLLHNHNYVNKMIENLKNLKIQLSDQQIDINLFELVLNL